ncbi:hypothetical protein CN234_16900 [Sinorhizobium meliloti]|uniref:hypothetical protein n=1 Tax=Rhizobium meliloti TaxID=382 RepID=UPI000FD76CA8|nr:hypothetical protein [Sinorhizobium meliloti]RVG08830.1 hypothetical protein CN234_16900 [Sinorhizobium meliloti]
MSVDSRALIGAVAIAFLVVVAVAVLVGEPPQMQGRTGGDPLRNLIYDFQTLITGVFALFAAAWTIAQMRATEERQARELRRQNYLQHRAATLSVERFVEEITPNLKLLAEHTRAWATAYVRLTDGGDWSPADKAIFINSVRGAMNVKRTLNAIANEDDAIRLFTPVVQRSVNNFDLLLRHLATLVPKEGEGVLDMWPLSNHAPKGYNKEAAATLLQLTWPSTFLADELEAWAKKVAADVG